LEFNFVNDLQPPSSTANAFQFYKQQAQTLDVATLPNTVVVYSGRGMRAAAENFADANGRTTLEKTPGGSWLDAQGLFGADSPLTTHEAMEVWANLSQRYAQGASGDVVGFLNNPRPTSISNTVEFPTLQENPAVTNILTGGK
jgi:hypothetical protein